MVNLGPAGLPSLELAFSQAQTEGHGLGGPRTGRASVGRCHKVPRTGTDWQASLASGSSRGAGGEGTTTSAGAGGKALGQDPPPLLQSPVVPRVLGLRLHHFLLCLHCHRPSPPRVTVSLLFL